MLYRKIKNDKSPLNAVIYKMDQLTEWIESGGKVGWIISDGYIAIDVDKLNDSDIIKSMLDYAKVKYKCHATPKGKHFIFKSGTYKESQGTNLHTPIGLRVDTRTANKGYIALPINDIKRTVLVDIPLNDVDEVPFWLRPLKISRSNDDFITAGMETARNDSLFKQVARLKASRLKSDEIKIAIQLINQFVFKESLPLTELETTVLREENLVLDDTLKGKLTHNEVADIVLDMYDLKYIDEDHYIYNDGYFQPATSMLESIMLDINPAMKIFEIREVFNNIRIRTKDKYSEDSFPEYYLNLKNGIYSLKDKAIIDHRADIAGRIRLNFEYTNIKKIHAIDKFLLDIANGNKDRAKLLLQMIGYSMTRSIREQVLFFLYGPEAENGKSTLIDVISALLGKKNISHLSLQQITSVNDKFAQAELNGKICNLYADISDKFLEDVASAKNLTTGDMVTAQHKYKNQFSMRPIAKLIFSANKLPKSTRDKGWERRLLIIPFEKSFSNSGDFDKGALLTPDALNYLGTIALEAYQELYDKPATLKGKWSDWESSSKYLDIYKKEIDSAYEFFTSLDLPKLNCTVVDGERLYLKTDLYNKYKEYAEENGLKEKSKKSFGSTIRESLKDKVFSNKHYWIIIGD